MSKRLRALQEEQISDAAMIYMRRRKKDRRQYLSLLRLAQRIKNPTAAYYLKLGKAPWSLWNDE